MKNLVVVDSSVAVKWCNSFQEKYLKQADKILEDARKGKIKIFVPELAKYEVGNAILYKKMEFPSTQASLSVLYLIPLEFIPMDAELASNTLEIAFDQQITYYDASFIALAKRLKATLITDNPKHQKKNLKTKVKVLPLGDYG